MNKIWNNLCFYGRVAVIVVRDLWKRVFHIVAIAYLCGCVNIYTRNPITDMRIEDSYQSTEIALTATLALSFPQMVSLGGNSKGLQWYNCLTIPFFGLPCAIDSVCEGVLDTVFYPIDYLIVEKRHPSKKDSLVGDNLK